MIKKLPATFLCFMIRCYRFAIGGLFGPCVCRFTPTCSSFAILAIEKHGVIVGSLLAAKRLLSCHPFHRGGVHLP